MVRASKARKIGKKAATQAIKDRKKKKKDDKRKAKAEALKKERENKGK